MDSSCSPIFTETHPRRKALSAIGALAVLGTVGLPPVSAQEATPSPIATDAGVIFAQTFGSGSLFRTQGSGPDLPPFTLYLWETGASTIVVTDQPGRVVGVLPTDKVVPTLISVDRGAQAVLIAPPNGNAADRGLGAWVLNLVFAGIGSDPGSLTYQGELVPADEAEARFGVSPAPAPEGAASLGDGVLFITGAALADLDDAGGVQVQFPSRSSSR